MVTQIYSGNDTHIALQNVNKSYGNTHVLTDLCMNIQRGERVSVVGPSGCGKSTLLKLILGEQFATSGNLLFDNTAAPIVDSSRGVVFQKYGLFPNLTLYQNVEIAFKLKYSSRQFRKRKAAIRDNIMDTLVRVRLDEHLDKMPHELSGGQQQRVAIAQMFVSKPKIILMDEPFGALDPGSRSDLQLFFLELQEEMNATTFFITHDLSEAIYVGSRLIGLSQYYKSEKQVEHGATIVTDIQLPSNSMSSDAFDLECADIEKALHAEVFDMKYLQHSTDFRMTHPHALCQLN